MSEKQSVSGVVAASTPVNSTEGVSRIRLQNGECFTWPQEIPEGMPVRVTVEIGGRKRKGEK